MASHATMTAPEDGSSERGFTLLELTVVLVIGAIMMAFAANAFSTYQARASSRGGAQVFAGDLKLARSSAKRGQESVVIRFFESSLWYTVTTEGGRELIRRRFGPDESVNLSAIDLELAGDSVLFDSRGVADLSGTATGYGTALFVAGTDTMEVYFNAMGASRITEH